MNSSNMCAVCAPSYLSGCYLLVCSTEFVYKGVRPNKEMFIDSL